MSFRERFGETVVVPIGNEFPTYPLAGDIQATLDHTENLLQEIGSWSGTPISIAEVGETLRKDRDRLQLFKQAILQYRRHRAAETESLAGKTFHLELATMLEQDVRVLDALVSEAWFQEVETKRLPFLRDFLPIQYIEAATIDQVAFLPRQYEEKFHILQAPHLFLPDFAYFRAKCEQRGTSLAIGFLDIDNFKQFNVAHTETKIDRNLLPRFMQTVEAHVFHHGYAYRQGGDEYLVIVPSFCKPLALAFFDELRLKLAEIEYPDIKGRTTISTGLCIASEDCPLTDRELRDRASRAKQFAKDSGRNRIALFDGPRFVEQELHVAEL